MDLAEFLARRLSLVLGGQEVLLDHLGAFFVGCDDRLILRELGYQILEVVEGVLHELGSSDAHLVPCHTDLEIFVSLRSLLRRPLDLPRAIIRS